MEKPHMPRFPRLLALFALLPVACSHPSGKQAPNGSTESPSFDQLPAADRQAFATWKSSLLKTCDWHAAFPSFSDGQAADPDFQVLDVNVLLGKTGGKAMVQGDHGEVALLDAPQPGGHTGFSDGSVSRTENGHALHWSFGSQLSDDQCVIRFQDQEIFRGPIAGSMSVTGYADADAVAATQGTLTFGLAAIPTATSELDTVSTAELSRAVLAVLTPSAAAQKLLATRLGLTPADAAARFPLATSPAPSVAAHLVDGDATWFAPNRDGGDVITGSVTALAAFNPGAATTLSIDWLFVPPTIQASGYDSGEAQRRWVLRTELQLGTRGAAGGKQTAPLQLTALRVMDPFALSDTVAAGCFVARADNALAFVRFAGGSIIDSYDGTSAACAPLAQSFAKALAGQDDAVAIVVAQAFADRANLAGWDEAVIAVATELAHSGADLAQKLIAPSLAPAAATRVRAALDWRDALAKAIAGDTTRESTWGDAVLRLAFTWSLSRQTVPAALITSVAQAIVNAGARFDASVKTMLADVGSSTASDGDGAHAASCGAALTPARADAIDALIKRMSALAPLGPFSDAQRGAALQNCWSDAAVTALQTSTAAAEQFAAADAPKGHGEYSYDDAVRALLEHAVAAGWTPATYGALGDMLDYLAPEAAGCDGLQARASQARCVDASLQALGPLLDGAGAARYAGLARALRAEVQAGLDYDLRYDLAQAFIGGVWLSCSDAQFSARQTWVVAQLDKIRQTSDFDQRYQLQTALESALQTCQ
jgi:hypothetical protein